MWLPDESGKVGPISRLDGSTRSLASVYIYLVMTKK